MLALLLTTLLACPPLGAPLDDVAQKIADLLCEDPSDFEELFSDEFLKAVPADKIHDLFAKGFKDHGQVVEVRPLDRDNDNSGRFDFVFADHTISTVTLTVQEDEPHKVTGFFLSPRRASLESFEEIARVLKALPGDVSFKAVRLGDTPKTLGEVEPDKQLAIGSAFKLYVLGALVEDKRKWDEVVTLKDEWKSLPSGILQTWPAGAPVTLHTLATEMISISDNTAADHLLHIAGRERVEKAMELMGNANPERSMPFIGTAELFKLRTSKALRKTWLKSDLEARRSLLDTKVKNHGLDKVQMWSTPGSISRIEWFASGSDLCKAMEWFRKKGDETALGVLAVNRGLPIRKDVWPYCGFKGGSEPGVLSLTYLLKRDDGAWFALSVAWNDRDNAVNENQLLVLVGSAIDILAKAGR